MKRNFRKVDIGIGSQAALARRSNPVDRNAADSVRDHPQMMSAPSVSLDIKKTAAFVIIDTDTYTLYPRWPMAPI